MNGVWFADNIFIPCDDQNEVKNLIWKEGKEEGFSDRTIEVQIEIIHFEREKEVHLISEGYLHQDLILSSNSTIKLT